MDSTAKFDLMSALVLEDHLVLLEEVGRVLHEENRLIQHTGLPPDAAFIRRKARLLPRLELSLGLLRAEAAGRELPAPARDLRGQALRTLQRLVLLDRENEGLLGRCALRSSALSPSKYTAFPTSTAFPFRSG